MTTETPEKPDHSWDETLRTIIIAVVLAMTFRSLAFEPFHIPSGSMKSNLLIGDYLFVSKYSYGYSRYSFPYGINWFEGRVAQFNEPERGDIIVFRLPSSPNIDYIKRMIGLPGEVVQLREGLVYINGKQLPREPFDQWADKDPKGNVKSIPRLRETLPNGKEVLVLKERRYGSADDTKAFIVPEGHYFFMGDNRDNSVDSRYEDVGFVPAENIVGKAQLIFFSTDGTAELKNPISWVKSLRVDRFFTALWK